MLTVSLPIMQIATVMLRVGGGSSGPLPDGTGTGLAGKNYGTDIAALSGVQVTQRLRAELVFAGQPSSSAD